MRSNIANLAYFLIFATKDEDRRCTYDVKGGAHIFKKSRSLLKTLGLLRLSVGSPMLRTHKH